MVDDDVAGLACHADDGRGDGAVGELGADDGDALLATLVVAVPDDHVAGGELAGRGGEPLVGVEHAVRVGHERELALVERAVLGDVGVVLLVEQLLQRVDLGGVVFGLGLLGQEQVDGVAHLQDPLDAGLLGLRDGQGLQAAAADVLEGPVLGEHDPAGREVGAAGDQRLDVGAVGLGGAVGLVGQAAAAGDLDDAAQRVAHLLADVVGVALDDDLGLRRESALGDDLTEDVLRVPGEVAVVRDPLALRAADLTQAADPRAVGGLLVVLAPAEDEQVGDDVGACGVGVGAGRQADRADEVGLVVHGLAVRGVLAVHRVVGREHRDDAAGAGHVDALEDRQVVQRVLAGRVVTAVERLDVAERHVADGQVEGAVGQVDVLQALVEHELVGVEVLADRGGDRVELDADHAGAVGGAAHEGADAAAGLERGALAVVAEVADGLPDRVDHAGVGVVRVQGVLAGCGDLVLVEQLGDRRALLGVLLDVLGVGAEHRLGQRAPAGPAGQDGLLVGGRRPVLGLQGAEGAQGRDVRLRLGRNALGCEVSLRRRAEPGCGQIPP